MRGLSSKRLSRALFLARDGPQYMWYRAQNLPRA